MPSPRYGIRQIVATVERTTMYVAEVPMFFDLSWRENQYALDYHYHLVGTVGSWIWCLGSVDRTADPFAARDRRDRVDR